jgi:hypothetical protein
MNIRPNIVLVHGAWAEGSCWTGVIERLQADGYHPVTAKALYAVQQPIAMAIFDEVMGDPAWKTLPSWYMVAADPRIGSTSLS